MADYETLHETLHVCRYHTGNNVSNVGGDPVTQLNFKKRFTNLICHIVFQNMLSADLICICRMERYIIN